MLAWVGSPAVFVEGPPPAWVVAWKDGREKRAEKKKEKADQPVAAPDPAAQAKREAARVAKVKAGLDDLGLWMADLVRQGFAALGAKPASAWNDQARRMVDAQAPGLARRLKLAGSVASGRDGWQATLLDHLARIHLIVEGFGRISTLPPEVAEDVRSAIGFTTSLESVRGLDGVSDRWQVVGQIVSEEDNLKAQRTWLIGRATRRPALILDFSVAGKPLDLSLSPGMTIDADLAFFPGAFPLRALVKERRGTIEAFGSLDGFDAIDRAFSALAEGLARNPWLEAIPVVLNDVVLVEKDGDWSILDKGGATLPLAKRFKQGWHLLAIGGGVPFTITGEFDGATLEPLGACIAGEFLPLASSAMEPVSASVTPSNLGYPPLADLAGTAVVGIDRRPPSIPGPESPIGRALEGLDALEPAARVFAIAGATGLQGRAGRKPSVSTEPPPDRAPDDRIPEASPAASARLRRMLTVEQAETLPEWLTMLAETGRRVPFDAIVPLLELKQKARLPDEALVKVVGPRGWWVAAKNPPWRNVIGVEPTADPDALWETGTRPERVALLRELRRTDPARARALVLSTFARDPAEQRLAFLETFEDGLSIDDEPFLETTLDDRGKSVRDKAADLLRRLPESRLCLRMTDRARAILGWEGKTLHVQPPTACDKAAIRDGVEPNVPSWIKLGERSWWLRQVLSAVPPTAIASLLGAEPTAILKANRGGDDEDDLWNAFAESTLRHRSTDWAEPMLAHEPSRKVDSASRIDRNAFFHIFPLERREKVLLERLGSDVMPFGKNSTLVNWLQSLDFIGRDLARAVLPSIKRILADERDRFGERTTEGQVFDYKYHDYQIAGMIHHLGGKIPPDLVEEAEEGVEIDDPPRFFYAKAYREMLDRLSFRREMHREFQE